MSPTARRLLPLLGSLLLATGALAQGNDRNAERAARRMQLEMQKLQEQVDAATAAKTKAETDKAATDKQLAEKEHQVERLKGQAGQVAGLQEKLRAADARRGELEAAGAALEKQLAQQKRTSDDALAASARELATLTRTRDEERALAQRRQDEQIAQINECANRNERLVKLSAELLERWRTKTVADVMRQNEPILGLGDVEMFNLVQEYRDKAEAERWTPAPPSTKR